MPELGERSRVKRGPGLRHGPAQRPRMHGTGSCRRRHRGAHCTATTKEPSNASSGLNASTVPRRRTITHEPLVKVQLLGHVRRHADLGHLSDILAGRLALLERLGVEAGQSGRAGAFGSSTRSRQHGRHPPGAGLVGQLTVTVTEDTVTAGCGPGGPRQRGRSGGPEPPGEIAAAALRAAARALTAARARAAANQAAGGCAHTDEYSAYRPPPRLCEHVIARDVTCRNPSCGQPAWRGDLDHTIPWDDGGRTCRCDLGGACRRDHQLKQHSRWKLEQTRPGFFTWTTPAGRTYTAGPDTHPV
jgi:hypothetical protein